MTKFIVALKNQEKDSVISDFILGESVGWGGARLDREWFNSKEEAEQEILKRELKYHSKLSVYQITVSIEESC